MGVRLGGPRIGGGGEGGRGDGPDAVVPLLALGSAPTRRTNTGPLVGTVLVCEKVVGTILAQDIG